MNGFILASASPRRQEILSRMGITFTVRPQDVDENFEGLPASEEAVRIAVKKVSACIDDGCGSACWILGADTFIDFDGELIGKPQNRSSAFAMLKRLSGRTHSVITGLALNIPGENEPNIATSWCRTDVTFSILENDEIEWYLDTDEWKGAAAAYRIQEKGAFFVNSITGSYSNVMGLPINTFYGMLRANNYNFRN